MEAQLSPQLYMPTYCHYPTFPATSPIPKPQQPMYQQIIPSPTLVVPSATGHVFVQMQQILPILAPETSLIQPCNDNLAQQIMPCYSKTNQFFDLAACVPFNLQQKIHQINTKSSSDCVLNKNLRKKKVSPSAKRRSRLRLIAFLEAKKEKFGPQETTNDQVDNNSISIENTTCNNLISSKNSVNSQSEKSLSPPLQKIASE